MKFANRHVWLEICIDRRGHNLVGACDGLRRTQDAHPADHSVEVNKIVNLWLGAQDSLAVDFRCRDDEILKKVLPPRHFTRDMSGPGLRTLVQPGDKPSRQAAHYRSGKRR